MPIGAIAIGMRVTNPAAAKPFAPGALKISLYGLPMALLLDIWRAAAYIRIRGV
jgi:hypothetical protein